MTHFQTSLRFRKTVYKGYYLKLFCFYLKLFWLDSDDFKYIGERSSGNFRSLLFLEQPMLHKVW